MAHTGNCVCGDRLRFEACDIATGQVKAVLHPISASWEEADSQPTDGQMLIPARDYQPDDVWPHGTSVYISQIIDGERVGRWAGLIEKYEGASGGAVQVMLKSIDEYLNHRNLADDDNGITYTPTATPQGEIAAQLVTYAVETEGIPLVPVSGTSDKRRDRTYNSWDFKNIGEAINQLTNVIDGVRYRLEHVYDSGFWSTRIIFTDLLGQDRGVVLRGDIEGATYGVTVDAKDHATYVFGIGEGEEVDQLESAAYDAAKQYPRFHAVPAWKDVSRQETLDQHTQGYVANHRDPIATPSMMVPGLGYKESEKNVPTPEELQIGDRVKVEFAYGLIRFDGFCHVLSISWGLASGSPVTRTLAFQPEVRASDSVRNQRGNVAPGQAAPPPLAGAVSNLQDPRIVDQSGMTHSKDHN